MRSALLFCAAAVVATAVAAPSPCGPGCASSHEILPDEDSHPPAESPLPVDGSSPAVCFAHPDDDRERWARARMGNHRSGEELADRPPLRTAAGLEVRFESFGDPVHGDFAHAGCRNGATLKKLEVWGLEDVVGVRLTFHDGEEFAAGAPDGCYRSFDFSGNERLALVQQSPDGRRAAFVDGPTGEFAFRLGSRDGVYEVLRSPGLPPPHSGLICGISGTDGPDGLAALAFHFAPEVAYSSIVIDRSSFTADQITVTDRNPDVNTINLEHEPAPAEHSLRTHAFTYKTDSKLGYWAETSVEVTAGAGDDDHHHQRVSEETAPFDVDFLTFGGTREFSVEGPPVTIKFEIPTRSECTIRVKERVVNAFLARWNGTETLYFVDGPSVSMKISGTLRGYDVVARKMDKDCFPIGLVHSWHQKSHDWEDHCVATKCKKNKDCCGDLECIGGQCQSGVLFPPVEPPLELIHPEHVHDWLRQCAGAKCKADRHCCGDMVCNKATRKCESPFILHRLLPVFPEPEVSTVQEEGCAADVSRDDEAEPAKSSCCGSKVSHDGDAEHAEPSSCGSEVSHDGHAEHAKRSCCGSKAPHDDEAEPAEPSCCGPKVSDDEKPSCCGSKVSDDEKPSCCGSKVSHDDDAAELAKPSCCGSNVSHDDEKPSCCGSKVSDDDAAEPPKPSCCGSKGSDDDEKPSCCGSKDSDDDAAEPPKPSCCGSKDSHDDEKPSCCGSKDSHDDEKPSCCGSKVSDDDDAAEPPKPSCCGPPKPSCCGSKVSDDGEAEPAKHHDDNAAEPAKPSCCGSEGSHDDEVEHAKPSCCGSEGSHDDEVEHAKPSCCGSEAAHEAEPCCGRKDE